MAAITATVNLATTPPRVDVALSGWSTSGAVTVQRVHADTTVHQIYMPDTSGGVSQVYDYAAPFGEPVTYQSLDGSTQVSSAPVTISLSEDWISAPGYPSAVVPVDVDDIGEAVMTRDVAIMASPFRATPAVEYGPLQGDRFPVTLTTTSAAASAAMREMLRLSGVLLLRIPRTDYSWAYVFAQATRRPVVPWRSTATDTATDWRTWRLDCVTVSDPDPAPFGDPTASYQALADSGKTYQQLLDWKGVGATTYLDVLRGGF